MRKGRLHVQYTLKTGWLFRTKMAIARRRQAWIQQKEKDKIIEKKS